MIHHPPCPVSHRSTRECYHPEIGRVMDDSNVDHPKDLAEAEQLRQELTLDIQRIQAQLGDRQRTDEQGRRLSTKEYWAWKKRAQYVLNEKLVELRSLKAWIRRNEHPTKEDASFHLTKMVDILVTLQNEDVEFSPTERSAIEEAHRFLQRSPAETK